MKKSCQREPIPACELETRVERQVKVFFCRHCDLPLKRTADGQWVVIERRRILHGEGKRVSPEDVESTDRSNHPPTADLRTAM